MSTIETLFGAAVDPLTVVGCQVRRQRIRVSGLAGAATAAALGLRPTWCVLTLADGRTLTARTRGSGPEHEALEAFAAGLNEAKLREARESLARGGEVTFGPRVQVRPDGLTFKGMRYPFAEVVGFTVDEGHFMADGPKGLWLTLPLGTTDFGDALVAVLAELLAGKDYGAMPPDRLPRFGFLAPSARTHVPGTPTARQRLAVLGGLVALGLLVFAGWWASYTYENEVRLPAWWAQNIDQDTAQARAWLDAPPSANPPRPCSDERVSRETLAMRAASGEYLHTSPYASRVERSVKPTTYSARVVAWKRDGERGTLVRWHHGAPDCALTFPLEGCDEQRCEEKALLAANPTRP